MHEGGLTLFLVGVTILGLAPIVLLLVYVARRAADAGGQGEPNEDGPPRTGWLRTLSVGLAGVAVLALATAWYLNASGVNPSGPAGMVAMGGSQTGVAPSVLPGSLSGMAMTAGVTGSEAVRQVSELHGTEFPVTSAEIGQYGGGRVTVWVARSADAVTATAMVERMARRISEGGSPFDRPQPLAGEEGVWETRGMGQVHFFFARGNAAWWVSSDRGIARRVLSDVLEVAS